MKYTITKDQYRRVLLKYLNSFVGDLVVRPKEKKYAYRDVETSNKDEFANLWHSGPITKGCKKELSLSNVFIDDYESFIPINRKKVFSEVVLEYFILKTGIKCDCVEFSYFTGKYKDIEMYDDESDGVITKTEKKFNNYQYKKPKKQ